MEFLAPDNIAGQALLQLTARGSSIICELLRLSNYIPSVFLGQFDDSAEAAKYSNILLDFRYFKSASAFESKIDDDGEAGLIEEEFFTNHHELLKRFYLLFESIYKYADNFNSYLADMEKGSFLQHTIEGVLQDADGKQLLCEALYLYGTMLLLLDQHIPGAARERMIVAYYRYKGEAALGNVKMVQKLCADTGFSPTTNSGKRPANYPDEYFRRIPLPRDVIDMILGKLRTDDVYNRTSSYPLPAHRSTALASQASMLYVSLYFAPEILHSNNAVCREVVDKFYVDNWVIPMHMGFVVDLTEAWDPYKSAKTALKSALTREVIDVAINQHAQAVPKLLKDLEHLLTQGVLTDDYAMDNQRGLMHTVRCCNISLRWLMLHRTAGHQKVREAVRAALPTQDVLTLLLHTAQLEFLLKSTVRSLLDTKQQRFEALRGQVRGKLI